MRACLILCGTLAVASCGTRQVAHRGASSSAAGFPASSDEPAGPGASDPPPVPRKVVRRVLGPGVADRLRSFVGKRDNQTSSVALAITILPAIGARLDPLLRGVTTGAELMAIATRRNALARPGERPTLGDLLVFEFREHGHEVTLAGIVVGVRDADGTIEFIYLNNGVLRRGFANRSRPTAKRDEQGDVLNTFVRIHDTSHSHTRGLAGTVLRAHLRLDRLSRPSAPGEPSARVEHATLHGARR